MILGAVAPTGLAGAVTRNARSSESTAATEYCFRQRRPVKVFNETFLPSDSSS